MIKKKFTQILVGLIFASASAALALAQSNSDKTVAQIMKLETEYNEASKKLNADELERFYTADFMMTVRIPPRVVAKAESFELLRDPNFKRGTIESLTSDDVKVRVYSEDTAIVIGAWKRASKDADGKDTSASGRFTHVWVKQNGKWLLAAAHYSPNIDLEKMKAPNQPAESKKN
jgi:ketosteroid isomerase-like protein